MADLTPQERRDIDEAMRAFPFLPARLTIPIGRWVLGRTVRKLRRELRGPELVLAVAEVFPHEDGQQLWWESYQRRSPRMQRDLVDDLRRRQARNARS